MATTLTTKFGIGDTVYWATTIIVQKQHPCPDCLDTKSWNAISPAGVEYTFPCPRCSASYMGNNDLSLKYSVHEATCQKMTVGSVRVDTHDDKPNSYMCRETGVGSGSVYYENDLFATEEEAMQAAKAKAVSRTESSEWMVEQYGKSLSLSDYEMTNAERKQNKADRQAWTDKYRELLYALDDCTSLEEVRIEVEKFRNA